LPRHYPQLQIGTERIELATGPRREIPMRTIAWAALAAAFVTIPASGPVSGAEQKFATNIAAAVADPNRPEADRTRDANRKPAECLAFAGIKPGDRVADIVPGNGYFTRLFSKAAGPNGYVYAYIPSDIDAMYKKHGMTVPPPADPRYPNVSYIHAPIEKFVTPEKVDVAWTSQNYHDLHDKFFGPPDINKVNKAIYDSLKPGGVFIVLDHAAERGSGMRDTDTLHRIDEAAVRKEVEASGFKFVGESTILRNPNDPHTKLVFDPSIRGKTDQFILKFRKPRG
jgi:predicted methyltransferase